MEELNGLEMSCVCLVIAAVDVHNFEHSLTDLPLYGKGYFYTTATVDVRTHAYRRIFYTFPFH